MTAAPTGAGPTARERLRPLARSMFGLLAGFCFMLVVSVLGFAVVYGVSRSSFDAHDNPVTPAARSAIVALATVGAAGGGYLATRLARRAVVVHALLLAAMTAAALTSWGESLGLGSTSLSRIALSAAPAAAVILTGLYQKKRAIHSPTK